MKIYELKHLSECLSELFYFFQKYKIKSCLQTLNQPDRLLYDLLNSEFNHFSYLDNIITYSFDITYPSMTDEVYYFIFGKDEEGCGNSVMIELYMHGSFIQIDMETERYLPFIRDFRDESGRVLISSLNERDRLVEIADCEIMPMEEFKEILKLNPKSRDVTWIVVD